MFSGILIRTIFSNSVLNTLTWFRRHAKRPVKSVVSVKVLGTSTVSDEGFLLKYAYCKLLSLNVGLSVIVGTKYL